MCFKCRFWCIKCHFVFWGILCTVLGISCIFESLFMSAFYNESAGIFLVLEHYIIPSRIQNLLPVSIEKNFTKRIPFFTNLVSLKAFFLHRYSGRNIPAFLRNTPALHPGCHVPVQHFASAEHHQNLPPSKNTRQNKKAPPATWHSQTGPCGLILCYFTFFLSTLL